MNPNTRVATTQVLLALVVGLFSLQAGLAQTNTFPSSGNAGIGTTSPPQPLTATGYASTANGSTTQIVGTAGSGTAQNQLNITSTINTWGLILGRTIAASVPVFIIVPIAPTS